MEEARGLETYCLSPRGAASTSSNYLTRGDIQKLPGNDYDTQNILLASMVHSEIIKLNPGDASADRGVKRARFVVIKANTIPAILVEGGFVSNHMEAARVNRSDYRQSLAQAIARGVIKFVNDMGDRHMQLPGAGLDLGATAPAPKPVPVAPPVPSGLAHDPANGIIKLGITPTNSIASATSAGSSSTTTSGTNSSTATHKKKKKTPATTANGTNVVVSPVPPTSTPTPAATKPETPAEATSSTPGKALGLAEPTAPTPSPGAEKAPPEPDEPPTVNIYPTGPTSPAPGSAASTNATESPTPPATHEP